MIHDYVPIVWLMGEHSDVEVVQSLREHGEGAFERGHGRPHAHATSGLGADGRSFLSLDASLWRCRGDDFNDLRCTPSELRRVVLECPLGETGCRKRLIPFHTSRVKAKLKLSR